MSLNVMQSEQRITYSAEHVVTYYGWRVSEYDSADVHPFKDAEQRDRFVAAVGGDEWLAAVTCAAELGGDHERDLWREVLAERYPDECERATEAAEKFGDDEL